MNWDSVAHEMLRISAEIIAAARQLNKPTPAKRILLTFLAKAARTLEAVLLLRERNLHEQSQALVRTLFELRINFDYFVNLLKGNSAAASRRVMDAMMLEKIKQQRMSGFAGHDLVPGGLSPEQLDTIQKRIAARYTPDEFQRLRKEGFTGVKIEERARQTGHEEEYQILYRNLSRNIHSTDFVELFLLEGGDARSHAYLALRDQICIKRSIIWADRIIWYCNKIFRAGLDDKIATIRAAAEKLDLDQHRPR